MDVGSYVAAFVTARSAQHTTRGMPKGTVMLRAGALAAEEQLGLEPKERVLYRLLALPRAIGQLAETAVLPPALLAAFLAHLLDSELAVKTTDDAKQIVPLEVRKHKKAVKALLSPTPAKPAPAAQKPAPAAQKPAPAAQKPAPATQKATAKPDAQKPAAQKATAQKPAAKAAASAAKPASQATAVSTEGAPVAPREMEDLVALAKSMRTRSHYERLGVPASADDAAIKKAYMALVRAHHPDRLAEDLANNDRAKRAADVIFAALNEANGVLTDSAARRAYDAALASGTSANRVDRTAEADLQAKKAAVYLKKGDFAQAERLYKSAARLAPDVVDHVVGLAWAHWLNPARPDDERRKLATDGLEQALKAGNADAAYKLGLLARAAEDENGARRRFVEALKINPRHIEAGREVRLARSRQEQDRARAQAAAAAAENGAGEASASGGGPGGSKKAGMFGRLFGK